MYFKRFSNSENQKVNLSNFTFQDAFSLMTVSTKRHPDFTGHPTGCDQRLDAAMYKRESEVATVLKKLAILHAGWHICQGNKTSQLSFMRHDTPRGEKTGDPHGRWRVRDCRIPSLHRKFLSYT